MTQHQDRARKTRQGPEHTVKHDVEKVDQDVLPLASLLQRMRDNPSNLKPNDVIQFQRLIGNHATQALLTRSPHTIQRWPWGEKQKEISGPYDAKLNGEAATKESVKEQLGYKSDLQDVKPELSFDDLVTRAEKARYTEDPLIKVQFLEYFSKHYAPHLTGEIEYFQFLAQKVAYMDLQPGDILGANIDTKSGSKVDKMLEEAKQEKASDEESKYSSQYVVESKYSNPAGLNAFLILPSDGDKKKNAIVLFRGTGKSTMGDKRGEASGALADTDYGGVGRIAFERGMETMTSWLDEAEKYNRVTISGHSLGGAMAERFYVLASKRIPGKLRMLTYQGAAIDRISTVGDVMDEKDPQKKGAKATRVVARGDVVPLGGMAHVPGQKLKYGDKKGGKFGPIESHLQIELVKQQLNESLNKPVEEVSNVILKNKEGGTNFTKIMATTGKTFGSMLAHSLYTLHPKGLYNMISSATSKGKETK